MNQQLTSQQIAGQLYQQAEGRGNACQMALSDQQSAWLTRTYEAERRHFRDSVDRGPACSAVIDGRTLADYDLDQRTNTIHFTPRHRGTIAETLARLALNERQFLAQMAAAK